MKIAVTVPLEETVPPTKYGGTELVVYNEIEKLVEMGHEVYLLGTGDSTTSGTLVPIIDKAIRNKYTDQEELARWREYWKIASISKNLTHLDEIKPDVIHNHFAWRFLLFESNIKYPMFSTMHGPLTSIKEQETYREHSQHPFVSISNNQRKAMPDLHWERTVYNGLNMDQFPTTFDREREYFAFLGRTSPEKGLAELIHMIKKTDHKLKIAAKIDPVDEEYFATEIKPHVDGKQIEFIGEVDHAGKVELLSGAKALLLWLNWEEPFGLVITEAMACGAPVIVNSRGSMPELVTSETGFLVDSIAGMQEKLDAVDGIDPRACYQHVLKNFSAKKMTADYLSVAEDVIQQYRDNH